MGKNKNNHFKEKKKKFKKKNQLPTFNCHTHIFNFDHVHDRFIKGMFSIRFLFLTFALLLFFVLIILSIIQVISIWPFKIHLINPFVFYHLVSLVLIFTFLFKVIRRPNLTISIHWLKRSKRLRRITKFLHRLRSGKYDIFDRLANFIEHSYDTKTNKLKSQITIFNELRSYYSNKTKFVVHTMDLDYMINCKPKRSDKFDIQLNEIINIKRKKDEQGEYIYKKKIFPFIHVDPRRLEDKGLGYLNFLKKNIENQIFQGIKIYPALGYFPFDLRLRPIYNLAIEHNLPITTHCSVGPVYYRGKLKTLKKESYYDKGKEVFIHPFTEKVLEGKTPKDFTPHFTHPLNYYCLMHKHDKLVKYWNSQLKVGDKEVKIEEVKKYSRLKFCLGHFGGASEWIDYLKGEWLPDDKKPLEYIYNNWTHEVYGKELEEKKRYTWHTIIYDMLTLKKGNSNKLRFPYLYSDISYNLSNTEILPLLKVRLETNKKFAKKVLFGTDFYMVSTEKTEREATMQLRAFIGEDNFIQIAKLNPLKFLKTKMCDLNDLLS